MKKFLGFFTAKQALLLGVCSLSLLLFTGCATTKNELNIFTWADYVPAPIVEKFEKETGISVNYDNFSDNEEMLAKLQATKGGQYDIIVCSDYIIDIMRREGNLLQKLDKTKVPNFSNINPLYQNRYYDENNEYSIPYTAGGALLTYVASAVDFEVKGYKDLWNPALKNSVVLIDGDRDIIGMTLLSLGYSVNETDPAKLQEAKEKLMELKGNIIGFDSDKPHNKIISGEAVAGYMFGSQITAAYEANPEVKFVYPEEGLIFYVDNVVVPAKAPNLDNAYKFLEFILRPEISAEISSIINYVNCNKEATPFLPEEYLQNETVIIPDEVLEKSQMLKDLGESRKAYDEMWTEFKSK